jgi:predicted HTH transcriptional regulator
LIFKNKVEFINPCVPHNHGKLVEGNFVPYQKNPLISKFFLQLGWVEEIGSGFANVHKWLPLYQKKAKIEFNEEEVFTATVTLDFANILDYHKQSKQPKLKDKNRSESEGKKVASQPESRPESKGKKVESQPESRPESKGKKVESQPESLQGQILGFLEKKPLSTAELVLNLGLKGVSGQLKKVMSRLIKEGRIEFTIPKEPNSRLQKYKLNVKGNRLNKTENEKLSNRVLEQMGNGAFSKIELAFKLGQKEVSGQLNKIVRLLLKEKLIKQTIPEKPKSRLHA